MLKNYLKIAVRNLTKNLTFSFIHILGLTIGAAACILIFQYVYFERSYDRFHTQADNIYRVPIRYSEGFGPFASTAANHPGLGPAMISDFPEVASFTRLLHPSNVGSQLALSSIDENGHRVTFTEESIYLADSTFFNIFSFPLLAGDQSEVLSKPQSIVLSEEMADKYFGTADPLGKTISMNGRDLTVTGIMKNIPANSHLNFNALLSFNTFFTNIGENNRWIWPEFYTYVLLHPGTDPAQVEAKFPAFTDKYMDAIHKEHNFRTYFSLQPLLDIHLKSECANEPTPPGSERMVYFLTLLGIFILVIAWVNYVNLSTSRSLERAKEVGARKVVGASRSQLIGQFLTEALILNGISIILGLVLARLLLPGFSNLVGKNIGDALLNLELLTEPLFWTIFIGSILLGGIVAGIYPALVLSSFRPAQILKTSYIRSNQGVFIRKLLVGFQFVLSILLISVTLLVTRQLSFMNKEELGYNKEQVLVVKAPIAQDSLTFIRTGVLFNELGQIPSVESISKSSEIPGKLIAFRSESRKNGLDKEHNTSTYLQKIDDQYFPTYDIPIVAGRNFSQTDSSRIFGATNNKVLVNQVLASAYGFENPEDAIGQQIKFKLGPIDHDAEIIGVAKNYHQRSLKEPYEPILYYYPIFGNWAYYSMNITSSDWSVTISQIEDKYRDLFESNAFEYFFLDEFFDRQYQSDLRFSKVCRLIAGLAIFVASLGIFGLSALILIRRTKEIGMRKILGASTSGIMMLISRDFVRMLIVANLVALPLIVYFGRQWLNNFAFNVGLGWQIFALPIAFLLFIVLLIVGVQIYRTSALNPVESLRSD